MVERNDCPRRFSSKESGLPVNSTHSARPRFGGVFVYVYMVERNDCPRRFSSKESGLPVNSTHSARPRFDRFFVWI
ncbi:hypothetical protein ACX1IG_09960, partial [Yersinia enterocolitica]